MSTDDSRSAVRGSEFSAGLGPLPDARWKWAGNGPRPYEDAYSAEQMRKYAENAVAAERERCAKVCESLPMYGPDDECAEWYGFGLMACADAIRKA